MSTAQSVNTVASERGAALVMFVLFLPVLILVMAFVVDVGNWFLHKRHLQLQADAGALAGGGSFTIPCANGPIDAATRQYSGDPGAGAAYNSLVGANLGPVEVLINSTQYSDDGGANYSDGGGPCEAKMIDVKVTETDVPLLFRGVGLFDSVAAIRAHARVEVQTLASSGGALPIGVPDTDPTRATAAFVDEETGTVLATTPLTNTGVSNGLAIWDNAAAPVPVPISSSKIGVRIALSRNESSTACGDPLVQCYDAGSPTGIVYIRGWSSSGSGAPPNPPLARDVRLIPDTCSDPYFSSGTATCTFGVSAAVDFGSAAPGTVGVSATVGRTTRRLTYAASTGRWESSGGDFFQLDPGAGPVPVSLSWEVRGGTINGVTCTPRCTGTFGVVQRAFSASEARSGAIKLAEVSEDGLLWSNSFERGTTRRLVVRIGLTPNLENASDVNDPIVTLRVVGGSRNQSLDCEPANYPGSTVSKTNLWEELAYGCAPEYALNTGTRCAATPTDLWSSLEPWNCVAVQTGSATNQVPRGLNRRILGDEKPATCTAPNNWNLFPAIPPGDPRVLNVFITPSDSFTGSGSGVVPVIKLGTFYITGWTAGGSGFRNPCEGNGDDPVPGGDAGNIVGHFIKYVFATGKGGGSGETCDFTSFGSCVAVLTE